MGDGIAAPGERAGLPALRRRRAPKWCRLLLRALIPPATQAAGAPAIQKDSSRAAKVFTCCTK